MSEHKHITKVCPKCSVEFPVTTEYWPKASGRKYGIASHCKKCHSQYYHAKRDEYLLTSKTHHYKNKEDRNSKKREKYATDENYKKKVDAKNKEWRENNAIRVKEYNSVYRLTHTRVKSEAEKERDRLRARKHYNSNKDTYNAIRRSPEYRTKQKLDNLLNPCVRRAVKLRRRAKEYALPYSFSKNDAQRCLEYWGNKCAITGKLGKLEFDHWIPIADSNCPGTIATNIIPILGRINRQKSKKSPLVFLVETFDQETARKINQRIQEYFEWVKTR